MTTFDYLWIGLSAGIVNYYVTTLALWFGHWFSHLRWSPLRDFHVLGHHVLYPNSRLIQTLTFLYAHGRHDSNFALAPWLFLIAFAEFFLFPFWLFAACLVHSVVTVGSSSFIHLQFHVFDTPLERFDWFRKARTLHTLHHDADRNFMIADHFWDRVFGTYDDSVRSAEWASPQVTAHGAKDRLGAP
ncbi:MAG: hypothetical protein V3T12_10775 [Acidiferrobacterales bacterium]